MTQPGVPHKLRRHQGLALEALDAAWAAGRTRAWVELPPGAGKTLVGLLTAKQMLTEGLADRAVVLGPNTAIQGQWLAQADGLGLKAGEDRALSTEFTALTYQSLALFDPDLEVGDNPDEGRSLISRLHANGAALVQELRAAGPLLVVLDECHHLLEVWGRLLGEVLDELPQARVLGLTATPPASMSPDQAAFVAELFGAPVFEASIPALVREGDLAPFAEFAWLTTPTSMESEWLVDQAARFRELVHQLTDPSYGSTSFLGWIDARFLSATVGWHALVEHLPELTSAALRLHHIGLLALPEGAQPTEAHRVEPSADDWVLLINDWLSHGIAATGSEPDDQIIEDVRRALPAVGYQWTRRGIRRGRSPVDRVLARSASKMEATVQIVSAEADNLGSRLRQLVLCDHERASATLPMDLRGVIDAESGSARAVLAALVSDPKTAANNPLLVTGKTVAGEHAVLSQLVDFVMKRSPKVGATLAISTQPETESAICFVEGGWTSRQWVPLITAFFQAGHTNVLIGTRGLLGEGWDAQAITGLVDLTAVTSTTAVVQTRGRALRVDSDWPEKVAIAWTVVCVEDRHPKGRNDWDRLVRKHTGFYGVDDAGDVVDGVGHLDAVFSPYAPPAADQFAAINARMVSRSQDRAAIAARWQVGTSYDDVATRTVRLLPQPSGRLVATAEAAAVVVRDSVVDNRGAGRPSTNAAGLLVAGLSAIGSGLGLARAVGSLMGGDPVSWAGPVGAMLAAGFVGLAAVAAHRLNAMANFGTSLLEAAGRRPGLGQIGRATADALLKAGLISRGSDAVQVEVEADGEYRCLLSGVIEAESEVFATALQQALAPIGGPRYVLPRWTLTRDSTSWWVRVRAAYGHVAHAGEVWHPVPDVLGVNAVRAQAYATSWDRWVGGGPALFTGSPEGAGVLVAQRGSDPFDVLTVMRRQWQ